jgi:hypothetical protein
MLRKNRKDYEKRTDTTEIIICISMMQKTFKTFENKEECVSGQVLNPMCHTN